MNHLDDGTIQAFLDDELAPEARTDAAEHLLSCRRCQGVRDELGRARMAFSEAAALLDREAPTASGAPSRPGRRLPGSLVKAAGLVLLVAAAASAAVPGSPVNRWLVGPDEPVPVPVVEAPAPEPPAAVPPAPAGISLAATGPVHVAITGLDATLRLIATEGDEVVVSAVGGQDPVFRTGAGRIDVRNAVGGEVTVELPRSTPARLTVDGTVYAEMAGGELLLRVPADEVDGAHVWP